MSMIVLGILGYWTWKYRKSTEQIAVLVFSWGAFLLPTFTGSFSSMPRYVMVCLPIYFLLAQLPKKWWLASISVMTFLLIVNTILFIQGYWIA